jgi:mannose-1-phosphate guanylyltransferase
MALADRLVCAVMAGGSGTRFWPLSRQRQPKQLLKFFGDRSLLRATLQRIAPVCPPERQWVITARHLVAAAQADLPGLQTDHVIGEPVARNTAPCMALAALVAAQLDPAAILVLLPADHWIADEDAFRRALLVAAADADAGHIVTLGIAPSHPETGYGYIETGAAVAEGVHEVVRFVEKPSLDAALGYLADGRHLWNAGVFVLRADRALAAIGQHLPAVHEALAPLAALPCGSAAWQQALEAGFARCPSVSIDYGVMEHEQHLRVVRLQAGWSDVGTWHALLGLREGGRSDFTRGDVLAVDTEGCVLISQGPLLAAVGLRDLAVVATGDATLVLPLDRSQDVRQVVAALQAQGRQDLL